MLGEERVFAMDLGRKVSAKFLERKTFRIARAIERKVSANENVWREIIIFGYWSEIFFRIARSSVP